MILLQKQRPRAPCSYWRWELILIRCAQGCSSTGEVQKPSKHLETKSEREMVCTTWQRKTKEGETCSSQRLNLLPGCRGTKCEAVGNSEAEEENRQGPQEMSVSKCLALVMAPVLKPNSVGQKWRGQKYGNTLLLWVQHWKALTPIALVMPYIVLTLLLSLWKVQHLPVTVPFKRTDCKVTGLKVISRVSEAGEQIPTSLPQWESGE